ncbi:replication initiation factor domain-containing protein [Flavobacterium cerinum]|uniref:Replication initiation protein-like C-terminal domain-containing protein n=1 Tax=Flavobacterium cerinum TaxID=2502784 RepID=A0A444HAT1_9FLAO|nr:replication initiation factor domain-containing protein [Flavobacterium cerinum]RWX00408.1 hypothetical protein EPI11_09015 [Flavobacterium cerinum]
MLLIIDYLIINLKGSLTKERGNSLYNLHKINPFTLNRHEHGNKIYTDVYDLFYNNEKIGLLNAVPRASIIDASLIQLQFENHLFYTKKLNDLGQIVYEFQYYFDLAFDGVNRLDIAIDKKENRIKYEQLYTDLMAGRKLVKGREKNIASYGVTKKGRGQFNGFTVGKRSSSRFLRVYNKTEALKDLKNPKTYINDYLEVNNMASSPGLDVWRFEYQLNSTFFTYLRKCKKNITNQIFELETLIDLIELAEKNHFEIVENTGKTETNKEKLIVLHNWSLLRENLRGKYSSIVSRIKKIFEPSINAQKRLIKGLFRQYYVEQSLAFLYPLIKVLREYNLQDWFMEKYDFYKREFENKERLRHTFNQSFFVDTFNKLIV